MHSAPQHYITTTLPHNPIPSLPPPEPQQTPQRNPHKRQRAGYAERLILETDDTVDLIAERAGFETTVRLYRAFKKYGKPLPSLLRKDSRRG